MRHRKKIMIGLFIIAIFSAGILFAQDSNPMPDTPACDPSTLEVQLSALHEALTVDFSSNPEASRDNLFRIGTVYQTLAIQCGYEPTEAELSAMIQQVLTFAEMSDIITAYSVGTDVDAILVELDDVRGDLFNGQLLYNGLANGLDGSPLGCSGCHSIETAPLTEGTWTRADEIRLQDPALEGYSVRQYLVESILHPNNYVVPDYQPNLMPANFGTRLDMQMLADIVAYLESQDQLLED